MGIEVHVKDGSRDIPAGGHFSISTSPTANGKLIPHGCGMLHLPSGPRGGGHHVCAVLSDLLAGGAGKKDAQRGILERRVSAVHGKKG